MWSGVQSVRLRKSLQQTVHSMSSNLPAFHPGLSNPLELILSERLVFDLVSFHKSPSHVMPFVPLMLSLFLTNYNVHVT